MSFQNDDEEVALEFQSFDHQSSPQPGGSVGDDFGDSSGRFDADFGGDVEEAGEAANTGVRCWNVKYYSSWFDVTTKDVGSRLAMTVMPWSDSFYSTVARKPDLYGPFWVATTVIFMMAVTSNFASYLTWYTAARKMVGEVESWQYDFEKVSFGTFAVYGYAFVWPFILYLILKYAMEIKLKFLTLLGIYGYSLAIFIPASVLAMFPMSWLQWLTMLGAAALSTTFVIRSLRLPVFAPQSASAIKVGMIFLLVVGAAHLLMALTFKLYFFNHSAPSLAELHSADSPVQFIANDNSGSSNSVSGNNEMPPSDEESKSGAGGDNVPPSTDEENLIGEPADGPLPAPVDELADGQENKANDAETGADDEMPPLDE